MTPRPGTPPVTTPRGRPASAAWVLVAAPRTSLSPTDPAHREVEAASGAVSSRDMLVADAVRMMASSMALPCPGPSTSSTAGMSASTLSRHNRSPLRRPLAARPHNRTRRRGSSAPTTVPTAGCFRSLRTPEADPAPEPSAVGEVSPHRCTPRPERSAPIDADATSVERPDPGVPSTSSGRAIGQRHSPRLCWRGRSVRARRTCSPASSRPERICPTRSSSERSPWAPGTRRRPISSAPASSTTAGRAGAHGRHGEAWPLAAHETRSTICWTSRSLPHQGA